MLFGWLMNHIQARQSARRVGRTMDDRVEIASNRQLASSSYLTESIERRSYETEVLRRTVREALLKTPLGRHDAR